MKCLSLACLLSHIDSFFNHSKSHLLKDPHGLDSHNLDFWILTLLSDVLTNFRNCCLNVRLNLVRHQVSVVVSYFIDEKLVGHLGFTVIASEGHVVQDMNDVRLVQAVTIQMLIGKLNHSSHVVLGLLEVVFFKSIGSVGNWLDQSKCFWHELGKLLSWDEVAKLTKAVGDSVLHHFALAVLGAEHVEVLLGELDEGCGIILSASVLDKVAEVAHGIKKFFIGAGAMLLQLFGPVPVRVVLNDTLGLCLENLDELSSHFHGLRGNLGNLCDLFLNDIHVFLI